MLDVSHRIHCCLTLWVISGFILFWKLLRRWDSHAPTAASPVSAAGLLVPQCLSCTSISLLRYADIISSSHYLHILILVMSIRTGKVVLLEQVYRQVISVAWSWFLSLSQSGCISLLVQVILVKLYSSQSPCKSWGGSAWWYTDLLNLICITDQIWCGKVSSGRSHRVEGLVQ